MSARRLAYALVIDTAAAALISHTAFAQMVALGKASWSADPCAVACPQSNLTVAFVPVGSGFLLGESFTNRGAFADGCPACKDNSRGFFIPPGILMRMSDGVARRGVGDDDADESHASANGQGVAGGVDGGGSSTAGTLPGGAANAAVNSAAGTSSAANTGTTVSTFPLVATVTVNPEPATVMLIATGMLGLVPMVRRRRR
jgi:hypothetical protein